MPDSIKEIPIPDSVKGHATFTEGEHESHLTPLDSYVLHLIKHSPEATSDPNAVLADREGDLTRLFS